MKLVLSSLIAVVVSVADAYEYTWEFQPSESNGEGCKHSDSCTKTGSNIADLTVALAECSVTSGLDCKYDVVFNLLDAPHAANLSATCSGGSAGAFLGVDLKPLKEIDGPIVESLEAVTSSSVNIKVSTPVVASRECTFENYQFGQKLDSNCKNLDVAGFVPNDVLMTSGSSAYEIVLDFENIKDQNDPVLVAKVDDWSACGTNVSAVGVEWLRFYGHFHGTCLWCDAAPVNMAAGGAMLAVAVAGWLFG